MDDCKLAELFGRYRDRHDADALAEVFDRLAPGLLKVARHLTRDKALAEDLLQATFLTAMEKASSFDEKRPLRPWLDGILLRHFRHHLRKNARPLDASRLEPRAERDPGRLVEEDELEQAVEKALQSLPEKYRQVLAPRLREGRKSTEIARDMDRSPNVVRMQIHRGLDLLKKLLPQSLLTAWFGILWSRRALASVRGQVLAKTGALPPATLMVGGLVVFNKILLTTTGAILLIGATMFFLWIDDFPDAPEVLSKATPEQEQARRLDIVQRLDQEIEPILPQTEGTEKARPTESASMKGRVFNYHGTPAPGVRILTGEESVASDEAGFFSFSGEPEESRIDVAPPHVLARFGRELDGEDLLLIVAPRVDLLGTVINELGSPLEGTRIQVRSVRLVDFPEILDRTRMPASYPPARTDEQGRFAMQHLPGGCVTLRMEKRGYEVRSFPIMPVPDGRQHFTLKALASDVMVLTGRVEDHLQRVVPDAKVGFGKIQTRSDEWGTFRIEYHMEDIPERGARLYAAKPGYRTKEIPSFGGQDARHVEMVIRFDGPTLCISGKLLDARGAPIQGAILMPWGEEYLDLAGLLTAEDMAVAKRHAGPGDVKRWTVPPGARAYSVTDARGAFLVGGLNDRTYRFRIFDADCGIVMTTAPIHAGSRDVEIRIPPDAYRKVSGRVVDCRGEPIPGVVVGISFCRWKNSEDNYWDSYMDGVRTDEIGGFEFSRVFGLDTMQLNVDGEEICHFYERIEPGDCATGITLTVDRRCYFRIELNDPALAQSFRLLDEQGERLEITEHTGEGGTRGFRNTPFPLRAGKTEVVSASDRACTLQLLGKEEVQLPVRLIPGEITVLTY